MPKQMVPRRLLDMFIVKFKTGPRLLIQKLISSRLKLWVAQWLRDVHPLGADPFGAAKQFATLRRGILEIAFWNAGQGEKPVANELGAIRRCAAAEENEK